MPNQYSSSLLSKSFDTEMQLLNLERRKMHCNCKNNEIFKWQIIGAAYS